MTQWVDLTAKVPLLLLPSFSEKSNLILTNEPRRIYVPSQYSTLTQTFLKFLNAQAWSNELNALLALNLDNASSKAKPSKRPFPSMLNPPPNS